MPTSALGQFSEGAEGKGCVVIHSFTYTSAARAPSLARAPLPWHAPASPPALRQGGCPPDPTSGSSSGTRPGGGRLQLTTFKAALPGRNAGGTKVRRCSGAANC